ncbi:MAG: hypothetical protein QM539_04435 [Alphaproteobacteria bacterium]|nr:hypothetical protein [Alphaproteobacteria bacterium]
MSSITIQEALLNVVYSLAVIDSTTSSENTITIAEETYLKQIAEDEHIHWETFKLQRQRLNENDFEKNILDSCNIILSSPQADLYIQKCLQYLLILAHVSIEQPNHQHLSDFEKNFISKIERLLNAKALSITQFEIPHYQEKIFWQTAFIHLIWSIDTFDLTKGESEALNPELDPYLNFIITTENFTLNWDHFKSNLIVFDYDDLKICEESCKSLLDCRIEFRAKCLAYIFNMKATKLETSLNLDKYIALIKKKLNVSSADIEYYAQNADATTAFKKIQFALLHLILCIALIDKDNRSISFISPEEFDYFKLIIENENFKADFGMDILYQMSQSSNHYNQQLDESLNILSIADIKWKIKCIGYMKRMAWVTKESNDSPISGKEAELILLAQKKLHISDDIKLMSHIGLPSHKHQN